MKLPIRSHFFHLQNPSFVLFNLINVPMHKASSLFSVTMLPLVIRTEMAPGQCVGGRQLCGFGEMTASIFFLSKMKMIIAPTVRSSARIYSDDVCTASVGPVSTGCYYARVLTLCYGSGLTVSLAC